MVSPIKTVAVLGGSGNLGPFIVQELVAAGFAVTGVTREASTNSTPKFPDGLPVKSVDYGSLDALKMAFDGQDAVVSIVGAPGIGAQKLAVDAALAAGVKRFIPSEFGINTRKVRGTPIGKIVAGKIDVVDYLQEKAKKNPSFTWTGLSTGLFFDVALKIGAAGINLKDKTATVIDSGNEKWQASQRSHIGKAVAAILHHPEETANKYLGTASFNLSQNELIDLVEELTGVKLTVTHASSADVQKAGEEKLAQGDFRAFLDFLRAHNHADGAGNALTGGANELIGLPYEDLREVVKGLLPSSTGDL
ncbi:hypothetical protein B0H66DRAFT_584878 [Apodospora peruviana]|uniref:NmrA-like domain-containing protein n=1 Tax=Apodospora peruviana TaxID=516989 RepID=A0AAE0HUI8_9PEZI|nr:hypothetical protein B0H66DRAFT_584878 [Apodospora peruviana]